MEAMIIGFDDRHAIPRDANRRVGENLFELVRNTDPDIKNIGTVCVLTLERKKTIGTGCQ